MLFLANASHFSLGINNILPNSHMSFTLFTKPVSFAACNNAKLRVTSNSCTTPKNPALKFLLVIKPRSFYPVFFTDHNLSENAIFLYSSPTLIWARYLKRDQNTSPLSVTMPSLLVPHKNKAWGGGVKYRSSGIWKVMVIYSCRSVLAVCF